MAPVFPLAENPPGATASLAEWCNTEYDVGPAQALRNIANSCIGFAHTNVAGAFFPVYAGPQAAATYSTNEGNVHECNLRPFATDVWGDNGPNSHYTQKLAYCDKCIPIAAPPQTHW